MATPHFTVGTLGLGSSWDLPKVSAGERHKENLDLIGWHHTMVAVVCCPDPPHPPSGQALVPPAASCCLLSTESQPGLWPESREPPQPCSVDTQVRQSSMKGRPQLGTTPRGEAGSSALCRTGGGFGYDCITATLPLPSLASFPPPRCGPQEYAPRKPALQPLFPSLIPGS